jgi:ubiquitin carboxyl-terminal hydrolase 2/21
MNRYAKKYSDKGLTGLANIGNTCYINSLLQVLSHTYELNDFLNLETYKSRLNKKPDSVLLIEWDELRKMIWQENCIITPTKFVYTIHKLAKIKGLDLFTGFAQNDVSEFFLFIFDSFHMALCREVNMSIDGTIKTNTDKVAVQCFEMITKMFSKEYSEIWQMFYGVHVSQIISIDESKQVLSSSPEPFCVINLSIPPDNKNPSLLDCFDHYVQGEVLDGDNAWFNESTGQKQSVNKKIVYWSFPNILVIDFKRFNNKNNKNQTLITFPLEELDLSKYSIGYNSSSFIYDLYGICNHSGSSLGGHYTSFVKNANGKWYHYNDTSVAQVDNLSYLISPKAYCLFYRKRIN